MRMVRKIRFLGGALLMGIMIGIGAPTYADEHFSAQEQFIEREFAGEVPASDTLWLTKDIKKDVNKNHGS